MSTSHIDITTFEDPSLMMLVNVDRCKINLNESIKRSKTANMHAIESIRTNVKQLQDALFEIEIQLDKLSDQTK